jgi:hypothetical protein
MVGAEDIVFEEALVQDSLRNGWSSTHSPQRNSTPELKFPTPLINGLPLFSRDAGDEKFLSQIYGSDYNPVEKMDVQGPTYEKPE